MSQLFRIFIRLVTISFGFAAGCLTAALAFAFLSGFIRLDDFETYNNVEMGITLTIMLTGLSAKFAQIAFIPAFIAIIVFEIKAIQDWIVYLVLAAAISIIAVLAFDPGLADLSKVAIYIASAMAGGFIYWLFVGQRAGKWQNH